MLFILLFKGSDGSKSVKGYLIIGIVIMNAALKCSEFHGE